MKWRVTYQWGDGPGCTFADEVEADCVRSALAASALSLESRIVSVTMCADAVYNDVPLSLRSDPIACEIFLQLRDKGFVWRFTAADMSSAIVARLGLEGGEEAAMYSPRRIGKCFARYGRRFDALVKIGVPSLVDGVRVYRALGARAEWLGVAGLVEGGEQ